MHGIDEGNRPDLGSGPGPAPSCFPAGLVSQQWKRIFTSADSSAVFIIEKLNHARVKAAFLKHSEAVAKPVGFAMLVLVHYAHVDLQTNVAAA